MQTQRRMDQWPRNHLVSQSVTMWANAYQGLIPGQSLLAFRGCAFESCLLFHHEGR